MEDQLDPARPHAWGQLKELMRDVPDETIILTEREGISHRPLNGAAPGVYVPETTWRGEFHHEPDADTDPQDRALYEEAATHPNAVTAYSF